MDGTGGWVVVLTTVDYDEAIVTAGALDAEGIEVALPADPRRSVRMGSAAPMYPRAIEVRVAPEHAARARAIVDAHRAAPLPPGFADDEVQEWLADRAARRQRRHPSGWRLVAFAAPVAARIAGTLWVIVRSVA